MSQRQSPQSEVRGGVGDGSQTELDGVDGLMDEHLSKLKLCVEKHTLHVHVHVHVYTWI